MQVEDRTCKLYCSAGTAYVIFVIFGNLCQYVLHISELFGMIYLIEI